MIIMNEQFWDYVQCPDELGSRYLQCLNSYNIIKQPDSSEKYATLPYMYYKSLIKGIEGTSMYR